MKNCEQVQAALLDSLYDLLEPHQAQEVETHLLTCVACQQALTHARDQQQLLAAAARAEFPAVRFQAPTEAMLLPSAPPSRGWLPSAWLSWAVAASLLALVAGLGTWGTVSYRRQLATINEQARVYQEGREKQQQVSTDYEHQHAQLTDSTTKLRASLAQLGQRRLQTLQQTEQEILNRPLRLRVSGPEKLEPGAQNTYQIQVSNRQEQPVPARIDARVVDQTKRVVYQAHELAKGGAYSLVLPRDLPLGPNSDLSLVVDARDAQGRQGQVQEKVSLGAALYVTHLTTDKPLYQPGETVHFHSLTLERFSLKPPRDGLHLIYELKKPNQGPEVLAQGRDEVFDSHGRVATWPDGAPIQGVGGGAYVLSPDAPGGEYTLSVREADDRFEPQERKFLVNRYQPPQLNKELEFTKKSYGPGEEVVAACKVSRAADAKVKVANQPVEAVANIDGQLLPALHLKTDANGAVNVRFRLPSAIARGDASLAVTFQDRGSSPETLVRPVPIVLKKLAVEFFPEGGDLIAGQPNRVYFQTRTMLDRPAELRGHIVDEHGQTVVAKIETLHDATHPGANQGMGRFIFTPVAGRTYELKIDAPSGIEGTHRLPEVKTGGVVLMVPGEAVHANEPIRLAVTSAERGRTLLVGAYCRGRLMAHEDVTAKKGIKTGVVLRPETGIGGVFRITVFEVVPTDGPHPRLVPRAERLVYRQPVGQLKLDVHPDRSSYAPGSHVKLTVTAKDEQGKPRSALVMLAVADKSVLTLADEKTFRTMPTHFLLTSEVRRPEDLEHADFLLDGSPLAARAVDLLLGTQGWRRFAEQNPTAFRQKHAEDGDRLLVSMGQLTPAKQPKTFDFDREHILAIHADFDGRQKALQMRLNRSQQQLASLTRTALLRQAELHSGIQRSYDLYTGALTRVNRTRQWLNRLLLVSGVVVVAGLLMLGVFGFVRNLRVRFTNEDRHPDTRTPSPFVKRTRSRPLLHFMVSGAACVLLGVACLFSTNWWKEAPLAQMDDQLSSDMRTAKVEPAAPPMTGSMLPRILMRRKGQGAGMPAPGMAAPMYEGAIRPVPPPVPAPRMMKAPIALPKNMAPAVQTAPVRAPLAKADDALAQIARHHTFAQRAFAARAMPRQQPPAFPGAAAVDRGIPNGAAGFAPFNRAQRVMGLDRATMEQARLLRQPPAPPPPMMVREYAHLHQGSADPVRRDFAETLYWNPVLVLADGKGEAEFDLNDSVTTFQVRIEGNTPDGRLGAATADIEVHKPLVLEPTLPVEVMSGDQIELPLTIANNTARSHNVQVGLDTNNLKLLGGPERADVDLEPQGRTRQLYRLQPAVVEGQGRVKFLAGQGSFSDQVEHTFKIVPDGFPITGSQSDMLERSARVDVALPRQWLPGTLRFRAEVYPSILADLQQGLEAMLREPCGCFEQTSTSNYPNLLILNYLQETNQARPDVARRAKRLLAAGYQRLTSFECLDSRNGTRRGYEWFGGTAPPHEALTAYGLLEFRDMARVYDVDRTMLDRTRAYLMSQRDGQGGFKRNPRAIDTFGRAPQNITNAYIVWALTESGKDDDVNSELSALVAEARTDKDPYFLALVANSLLNRGRTIDAVALLKRLTTAQQADGHLDATQTSITGSGGRDLKIETTALTTLAWMKASRPDLFTRNTRAAIEWIGRQRGSAGGFGATQSTILALKAIIAYAKANKRTAEAGDLVLFIGTREVQRTHFAAGAQEAIILDLPQAEKWLKPGVNAVRLEITGKNVLPYTASWSYRTRQPASAADCPITLHTRLARANMREGQAVRLTVNVANKRDRGQGMTVAIIGLPGGLTLPEDLKQLKNAARLRENGTKAGLISAFEIRGRELVLYWRELAPKQKIEVNLDLIARVPGQYRGPASRAYLYYNADHKCWVPPLEMRIQPRDSKAAIEEARARGR